MKYLNISLNCFNLEKKKNKMKGIVKIINIMIPLIPFRTEKHYFNIS